MIAAAVIDGSSREPAARQRRTWVVPAIVLGILIAIVLLVMLSGSSASEQPLVSQDVKPQSQQLSTKHHAEPVAQQYRLSPAPPLPSTPPEPSSSPSPSIFPATAAELAASVVPLCPPTREWRVVGVTPWWGQHSHPWARGSVSCPNGCRISWSHNGDIEGGDILLYHANELDHNNMGMPRSGSKPDQRRALLASESVKLATYDDEWFKRFNSELSFRPRSFVRDTYVYWMFGTGNPVGGSYTGKLATARSFTDIWGPPIPTSQRRNDLFITWASSHCGSKSGREGYVREMLKHVNVTIVGSTCLANAPDDIGKLGHVEQWDAFRKFKFNLSFENHRCEGYVTEKFYLALLLGQVPVVMGAPNIADHAPPNSYIDASLYTPQELAEYLISLNENDLAYDAYHAWRGMSFDTYGVHMKREFLEVLRLADDPNVGKQDYLWQNCIMCNALECAAANPIKEVLVDGIPSFKDSCHPQWTPPPETVPEAAVP